MFSGIPHAAWSQERVSPTWAGPPACQNLFLQPRAPREPIRSLQQTVNTQRVSVSPCMLPALCPHTVLVPFPSELSASWEQSSEITGRVSLTVANETPRHSRTRQRHRHSFPRRRGDRGGHHSASCRAHRAERKRPSLYRGAKMEIRAKCYWEGALQGDSGAYLSLVRGAQSKEPTPRGPDMQSGGDSSQTDVNQAESKPTLQGEATQEEVEGASGRGPAPGNGTEGGRPSPPEE